MDKGILFYATNNEKIDYLKIAEFNARLIKKNMNVPVAVATQSEGKLSFADVTINLPKVVAQKKTFFKNGEAKNFQLSYHNQQRTLAYELSPFNETILMDVDYLILDDTLNFCWGNSDSLLLHDKAKNLFLKDLHWREQRLFDTGIKMYWATVIYFKKSKKAEIFFNLCKHIEQNYQYYMSIYYAPPHLFRNDYVVSVACHILNDYNQNGRINNISDFLLTSLPDDIILKLDSKIHILGKDGEWHYPTAIDQNVHIMNKFDLERICE